MNDRHTLSGDIDLDLPEFDSPPDDPMRLVKAWMERANEVGVREHGAAALATVSRASPSIRTVLVKEVAEDHFIFTTSATSRKGRELEANPRCSLAFYWRETTQQILINGAASKSETALSNDLFDSRPSAARATVIASSQSAVLNDESDLRRRARDIAGRGQLPRPSDWHAWTFVPDEIEFWHGSVDRLHRRLQYKRTAEGAWTSCRLQP